MPNWCNNVVTFKHHDPKLIARLVKAFNAGKLMGEFFPCPRELTETMAGSHCKGTPEAKEHELKQQQNIKDHGYANWYDWQTSKWGTKWDVGRREYEDKIKVKRGAKEVTLTFDSAWSPPIQFYEKMYDEQQFDIEAQYFEPGCGFIGSWSSETGDFTYDLSDTSHKWVEANIPKNLLDTFGVLDFLSEDDTDGEDAKNEE